MKISNDLTEQVISRLMHHYNIAVSGEHNPIDSAESIVLHAVAKYLAEFAEKNNLSLP